MELNFLKTKKKKKPIQKKRELIFLTSQDRRNKLKKLFKKCIGEGRAITKLQLFKSLYGDPENYSDLQIFYLWDLIKKDMNYLRRTTNYFIVSKKNNVGSWSFFIVTDWYEANYYINIMRRNIKRSKYMIKRCNKAVRERFYKNLD